MPHQLIASPYPEGHLVVRPGYDGAIRIGAARYAELRDAPPTPRSPPGSPGRPAPGGASTWRAARPARRSSSGRRPATGTPAPATS